MSMPLQASPGSAASGAPLLVLRKLDKRFGATHALKAVDLTFEEGEIHAIVGENGAGKSTLIKLLTGVYPRSSGEVFWRGEPVPLVNPHEAIGLGINAVHQEVVLCRHLSVASNIFLGDEMTRAGLLNHKAMLRRSAEAARRARLRSARRRDPLVPDHRPAAARRDGARRTARRQIPDLRRADRLSHAPGNRGPVQADPPPQGERRDHRLHQPSPRGSVRALRSRVDPARRRARGHAARRARPTRPISSP